jgi:hypothetical protein
MFHYKYRRVQRNETHEEGKCVVSINGFIDFHIALLAACLRYCLETQLMWKMKLKNNLARFLGPVVHSVHFVRWAEVHIHLYGKMASSSCEMASQIAWSDNDGFLLCGVLWRTESSAAADDIKWAQNKDQKGIRKTSALGDNEFLPSLCRVVECRFDVTEASCDAHTKLR